MFGSGSGLWLVPGGVILGSHLGPLSKVGMATDSPAAGKPVVRWLSRLAALCCVIAAGL